MFFKKKRLSYAGLITLYSYPKHSFIGEELRNKGHRVLRDASLLLNGINIGNVYSVSPSDIKRLEWMYNRLEFITSGLNSHSAYILIHDAAPICWAKVYVKEKQAKRLIEKIENLFNAMWHCLPQDEKNAILPAGYG